MLLHLRAFHSPARRLQPASLTIATAVSHTSMTLSSTTPSAQQQDTIYALSSGAMVKSGVAVIRLSGPRSLWCLEELIKKPNLPSEGRSATKAFEPRYASLRKLYCPDSGDMLDQALVLWFPGPRSFTGEDVVELQVHGSRAVIAGVFDAFRYLDRQLSREPARESLRAAEPGEFTRRAFELGRMDLTEVEGLADLLAADTKTQRKQALRQIDGVMRKQFEEWRKELLRSLAHSEAVIDFGGERLL